jgi:hypothetical protein
VQLTAPPPDPDLDEAVAEAFFAEGTKYELHISLPGDGRARLDANPKLPVPATLTEGDRTWPVTLRLKGTGSFRDLSGKAGLKVNFVADDPAARFHGLKRLTLDNFMQDPSMMHAHVAYWFYRHRGVPAPRHTFARVWLNGTYYGLYGVTETADEQLLKHAFPHDTHGNLYEANVSDLTNGKTDHFELEETDGLYEPLGDLHGIIDRFDAAPPDQYTSTLASIFDLPELLKMWAIELVTTNPDGYAMNANNYMLYHGEDAWHMFPWGHDQCFIWYRDVRDTSKLEGTLLLRCMAAPDCNERLDAAMLDLLPDWESGELATVVANTTALIQGDCESDPRAELACDTADVARFVATRPATIREELGPH